MKKQYVLDTNVLLHDPRGIFAFEDNDVIIPIYCIEEVDGFKKEQSERGRNARQITRYLDQLRADGQLRDGVKLDGGGMLKVVFTERRVPGEANPNRDMDAKILACALEARDRARDVKTVFVTMDTNLRIRADAAGVESENYEHDSLEVNELYTGVSEKDVDGKDIDTFYAQGWLPLEDPYYSPNEFIHLKDREKESHTALGKFHQESQRVVPINKPKDGVWGIRSRNKEQAFALDLLLNDEIKLITLVGKAGTGKTLVALAAGLQKVTEESIYSRLLVSRPVFPLGRDIGYLPGTVEEKLNPWMQPIYDNVEYLMGLSQKDKKSGRSWRELVDMGVLQIEPLTYIRGRSIPQQFMIVDEAQNLTPHEIKTIITRAGQDTKIVLTGDPYQIDNPYVDATNNGLVHIVNRFRSEKIAGHVTLTRGERSQLAELASNLL
ncbi:MAG: PhoH family protein [Deltaproteobacteria bacterium]|nr:PhoH family protein [Deltaproteobacteria bacterium]